MELIKYHVRVTVGLARAIWKATVGLDWFDGAAVVAWGSEGRRVM